MMILPKKLRNLERLVRGIALSIPFVLPLASGCRDADKNISKDQQSIVQNVSDFKYGYFNIFGPDTVRVVANGDTTATIDYLFKIGTDSTRLQAIQIPSVNRYDSWYEPLSNTEPYFFVSPKALDDVDWQRTYTDSAYKQSVREKILRVSTIQNYINGGNPSGKKISPNSLEFCVNIADIYLDNVDPSNKLDILRKGHKFAKELYGGKGGLNRRVWGEQNVPIEQKRRDDVDGFFLYFDGFREGRERYYIIEISHPDV